MILKIIARNVLVPTISPKFKDGRESLSFRAIIPNYKIAFLAPTPLMTRVVKNIENGPLDPALNLEVFSRVTLENP